MRLKPSTAALVLLAGCVALLAARGWLFPHDLRANRPLVPLRAPSLLTIYFHERRPYYYEEAGQVRGLVAERAAAALQRAGIPHRWLAMPPARQLQDVRDGAALAAGLGWIATEERREFAVFSEPLWRDGRFVALVRADDSRLRSGDSIAELFADRRLTLLLKDSYSYGSEVDALIARWRPTTVRTPSPSDAMLRMLAEKRADYFLLSSEEAAVLIEDPSARALRIIELADAPRGVVRHLMFSRRVPAELVQRFNVALSETMNSP